MEIKQTSDYSQFKTIKGNRTILETKVLRIKTDVENGLNLFPYCPIVVNKCNEDLLIIDGQHRFTACKELGYPVYYVIAEDISLRDIARMNSNTDKWKNVDFLDCYIQLGNADYIALKKFIKDYRLNYSLAVELLMNGTVNSGHRARSLQHFKDGNFKSRHLAFATELIKTVDTLMSRYTFHRDRNLIEAINKLNKIGKWDLDVMSQKISSHPHMMEKCGNTKNYMYLLEQIYNVRNRERKPIL